MLSLVEACLPLEAKVEQVALEQRFVVKCLPSFSCLKTPNKSLYPLKMFADFIQAAEVSFAILFAIKC